MAKPLDEFGGWLRFYQISCWISAIIMAGVLLIFLVALLFQPFSRNTTDLLVNGADVAVALYLTWRILRILKIRSPETPVQVRRLMLWIAGLTFAFLCAEIPIAYWANHGAWRPEDAESVKGSIQVMIWAGIWSAYFKRARRVQAYYGV